MVPFPQINPSSQVVAGLELIKPLSGTFSFFDWDIAPLEVSRNKNIKTTGKQTRVFIISNFNSISKLIIQCRLVNKTDFDFAQSDGHPERSPRLPDGQGRVFAFDF
jgi:hypothetical protein